MKRFAVHWLWALILGAVLLGVSGCASREPQNTSLRPWNSPQGWGGGIPMVNQQQPP